MMRHLRILIPIVFFGLAFQASAQITNELKILRVDVSDFPTIKVYVRLYCNGVLVPALQSYTVHLTDGGIDRNYIIHCPSEQKPISVGLCLDASASMSGTSILKVKEGANDFVDLMEVYANGSDEAAVVSFNVNATLEQSMTSDKALLHNAINSIFSYNNTAIWDALGLTLDHVAANAKNPLRAVLLLSDGGDNSSRTYDLAGIIAHAKALGIPVYCIGIGYNDRRYLYRLQELAQQTGGQYFEVNSPDEIVDVFNAIASIITGGKNDCEIAYTLDCADGTDHTVTVTTNACGNLTATANFTVPANPYLPSVQLRVDTLTVYANQSFSIPIRIASPSMPVNVKHLAFNFSLGGPLVLDSVTTQGYFAEPFTMNSDYNNGLFRAELFGNRALSGSWILMVLHVHSTLIDKDTTVSLCFSGLEQVLDTCMSLTTICTNVRIMPRAKLKIACSQTVSATWNDATQDYNPVQVQIAQQISNISKILARKIYVRVYVPYGLELLGTPSEFVMATDSLKPGATIPLTLAFHVTPTDSNKTLRVCIEVRADSGAASTCCTDIKVEAGRPALRIWCSMPQRVVWDSVNKRYDPETFPVVAGIVNISPIAGKNLVAKIRVPNGFRLSNATPALQVLSPSILTSRDSAAATWLVTVLERPYADSVRFCIDVIVVGDTATCCHTIYVQASPSRATLTCSDAIALTYNEEKQSYDPPEFEISTMIKNMTSFQMAGVWTRIVLPHFLSLATGESEVKYPNGTSIINQFDSVRVAWRVTGTSRDMDHAGDACIEVYGSNYPGSQCCVPVHLEFKGAAPQIICSLSGPDTVRYVAGSYVPNPVKLDIHAINTGVGPARMVRAALLQGADVSIDSTDSALKLLTDSLGVGATVDGSFLLRILPRTVKRYDTVRVSVYAENGGAVVCEKVILIEPIRVPSLKLTCSAPDSLRYHDYSARYRPGPFQYTLTALNTGDTDMDSVSAEILLPSNMELIQSEQPVKMMTPSYLKPAESATASWAINALVRTVARVDTIRATVRYKGMIADIVAPCGADVFVPEERFPKLATRCSIDGTLNVSGDRYDPDSIIVKLTVENTGTGTGYNLLATLLDDARVPLTATCPSIQFADSIVSLNGTITFTWRVKPNPAYAGDTINICMRLSALRESDLFCCASLVLPPLDQASIRATCSTVDTVYYDAVAKSYPNPIILHTTVGNPTTVAIDTVRVSVILPRDLTLSQGEQREKLISSLAPSGSADLQWLLDVQTDTTSQPRKAVVRLQYFAGGKLINCERTIVIMPAPKEIAELTVSCVSPERIDYVNATIGLSPSPFSFTLELLNSGSMPLTGINATLRLPDAVDLASGESLTKSLPTELPVKGRTALQWMLLPRQAFITQSASFLVYVNCTQLPEQSCTSLTIIDPISRLVIVELPTGTVARAGQSTAIPMTVANPDRVPLHSFEFTVSYDPVLVEPTGIVRDGTLTSDWSLTDYTIMSPGTVRLRGASSEPTIQDGTLVYIVFRIISGDGTNAPFGIKHSDLRFTSWSIKDTAEVVTKDGDIWTTGDCLTGLNASNLYELFQNMPNPFNPRTTIRYFVPGSDPRHVTLTLYDMYGRPVRTIVNGYTAPGMRTAVLDADDLPSGTYIYELRADGVRLIRKMSLLK